MGRMNRWLGLLAVSTGGCVISFDEYQAACEPGTVETCPYSGPASTEGVGACKAGARTCKADGSGYGACAGEVTPRPEDCVTDADEDCDGETFDADAGCVCKPGTEASCYSGPSGTEGVSPCKTGTHTCDATGKSYGACTGEIVPQVEQCDTPGVDENCDNEPQCTGAHLWSKRYGDADYQIGTGIAVDGASNVMLTGTFAGSVDFGGGMLTSAGNEDIFVAKLDPQLNHLWSKRFGGAGYEAAYSITVDGAGNVVLTGQFTGSIDFGGGTLNSAGSYDIFVAKLDPQLNHLWSKRFGGINDQFGTSVAVDGDGNVVLMGSFDGSVDFGGGTLNSTSGNDIFVAKLDPQLNHLQSKRFGGDVMSSQHANSIAADGAGNVVLTGYFVGWFDFGGGMLTSAGGDDIFVAKLDPQLNHLQSVRFGGAGNQYGESVAVDGGGNVVLTGNFQSAVDFGGGALTSAGSNDIFVAKLDPQLNYLQSVRSGGAGNQYGDGVAVDGAGNIVVTGNFEGSVDFGGGILTSAGGDDIFVAKLDPQLKHLWSKRFGGTDDQQGNSIAVDGTGNVVLTGVFNGSTDFGGGQLNSALLEDIFVAKLAP